MKITPVILVLMAIAAAGCSFPSAATPAPAPASSPAVATVAAEYQSYRKMTDREVLVDPQFATLCIGASQQLVERARESKGPHAHSAILVFMNSGAAEAFAAGNRLYPEGAVIVKRKMRLPVRGTPDHAVRSQAHGVGGMVKRAPGFDPPHGDWEYFYFEDPAQIESGRIASCVTCHAGAKRTDHVFGTWAERATFR